MRIVASQSAQSAQNETAIQRHSIDPPSRRTDCTVSIEWETEKGESANIQFLGIQERTADWAAPRLATLIQRILSMETGEVEPILYAVYRSDGD